MARESLVLIASILAACALGACSAMPTPPLAPSSDAPRRSSVQEYEQDLQRDEQQLQSVLTSGPKADLKMQPSATSGPPPPPPTPVVTPSSEPATGGAAEASSSPCATACRALASMRRSAEGICELAGASDPKCDEAKKRVEKAEQRVKESGCQCS